MTTKLTLSIDKKVIEKSKKYAAAQNRSLSDLVEAYLRAITESKPESKSLGNKIPEMTDKVRKLRGSFKLPHGLDIKDLDYKEVIREQIIKKYG